ncbi:hypothetical protein ACVXHA_17140 [Escherichia coli]
MLTPHWMYAWFLPVAAETTNGDGARRSYCGVLTLIGGAGLLWRRLTNRRVRANFHYAGYYHHEHFADPVSAG